MACANPEFKIKSSHYSNINYKIPCRRCINCRIDRQNMWVDRCTYEFKKRISGAFVTFTYDDEHLYNELLVKGNDEKIRASLKIDHARKFIERIRKYIENHEEIQNILCQKDFTYCGVGEYGNNGEIFDRPHFHILFFGLDFKYCESLFKKEWQKGFIDSLPILNGGIRYVLKYMDKQIIGKQDIWENYKRWRLEEPKQFQSKGLGSELYYKNYNNAQKNNGTIKNGMKKIMIPTYYKNKMGIRTSEIENNKEAVRKIYEYERIKEPKIFTKNYERDKERLQTKLEEINKRKCRNLYQMKINMGEPVFNIYNLV